MVRVHSHPRSGMRMVKPNVRDHLVVPSVFFPLFELADLIEQTRTLVVRNRGGRCNARERQRSRGRGAGILSPSHRRDEGEHCDYTRDHQQARMRSMIRC